MTSTAGPETPGQHPIGHGSIRVAAAVMLVGFVLTLAAAGFERSREERERELTFGRDAEALQQTLGARVGELARRFESALSFIGATHPVSGDVYDEFFLREIELYADVDPGVMFIEQVPRGRLDDLERRERSIGNVDFAVTTELPTASPVPALVVTRAMTGRDGDPFPFLGYDIFDVRSLLIPESLPDRGYALRVAESSSLLSRSIDAAAADELVDGRRDIPTVSPFFVGRVVDGDDRHIGWAIRFLDGRRLSEGMSIPAHLNVRLHVRGIDQPLAVIPPNPASPPQVDGLYEQRVIEMASQQWSMDVWADPAFGQGIGLLDQTNAWAIGLLISSVASIAAGAWSYYRWRLAGASFELEHARTLATTDHLTGLLNRQGLIDAARLRSPHENATLYFVDLDGFKAVNDAGGHAAGDAVLAAVAVALRASFRHDDLVSRLGGDEFVVFTTGDRPDADLETVAQRVVERIGAIDPIISCSMGIAHRAPGDGTDVKDLLRRADEAMYRAKRTGGDRFSVGAA